jgi:branched-chain amino acid transport system substrate-binding protein
MEFCAVALLAALTCAVTRAAQTPAPIRIGATASQTGVYTTDGQTLLRGYRLCLKNESDKGGVLGRKLELLAYDDASDPATALRLYEKLITHDRVDVVLSPFNSALTDPVANVTEKHRMPMVAPIASATSMYKKGRKFLFSVSPPPETWLEGLIDLAAKRGLKTVALIHPDDLGGRTIVQGTRELARRKRLQVLFVEAFRPGTTDFSTILTRVRDVNPDVLGAVPGSSEAAVAIVRQLKALNVNPRMYGAAGTGGRSLYEFLGRDAEFVYGAVAWLPELVDLRAGGLIPIARQYPGVREFAEAYRKEYADADLNAFAAAAYGGCQILVEAIRRAGSLGGGMLRDAIAKTDYNTVFGAFRVDREGIQVAHKFVMSQWQDGKRAIIWPEELAPSTPRFPTPPWNQRP